MRRKSHNCTLAIVVTHDNALIGTFVNEEEESQLYISYGSDSHENSHHGDANNF